MFSDEQKAQLSAKLNSANVKTRQQAGRSVSYIEGWKVIEEANRIFGFEGWTRETFETKCVSEREREIGQQKTPGWSVSYIAKTRIRVGEIVREGIGAGHGIDRDIGQAHESAIKEAETDAMKRALMTFGYPFGLALYDKQQEHVAAEKPAPKMVEPPLKPGLLSEPAATEVAASLKDDIRGCVTAAELDTFIKLDTTKRRYASLPTNHRGHVSIAIKERAEQVKDRAA